MTLYLPIAQMSIDVLLLLALGAGTGILSGLFGVGGGFLMTPFLIFMGVPPAVSVASSANQIIASSVSGFNSHWRKGNVDFKMGTLMLIGGVVGSSVGVWVFSFLKELGQIDLVISLSYVLFLSLIGGTMAIESGRAIAKRRRERKVAEILAASHIDVDMHEGEIKEYPVPPTPKIHERKKPPLHWLPFHVTFPKSGLEMSILLPLLLSAIIGILVSILGIGGGFFMIPAMLYILKMPASVVVGTSLFQVIFVTANVTFLHAITTQSVDIMLAVLMLIGSAIGAQFGARMGVKLPEEYMRALLAGIVLTVALRLGINLVATPDNLFSVNMVAGS